MKVQVKRAVKSYCHRKTNEKADRVCMKFSSTSNIVQELEAKKNRYLALTSRQNIIEFLSNLGVSNLLEKHDELS